MRRLFAAVLAAVTFATTAQAAPTRVLSMNVCADQYLIALADKDQIAALSNYARDKSLSYYADKARDYPQSAGKVEEILALAPDLIVAGTARRETTLAEVRRRGVPIVEIKPAESYAAIVAQTRQIAAALDHAARGEAVIAQMDRDLAAVPPPPAMEPEAAYYQRRGFLTGTGTLIDDIMRRAGLRNLAARLGRGPLSKMPLELIIQAKPDYLVLDAGVSATDDNGAAMLFHPALEKAVPASHRLFIPGAATVCGGPFFPTAVAQLAAQIPR